MQASRRVMTRGNTHILVKGAFIHEISYIPIRETAAGGCG